MKSSAGRGWNWFMVAARHRWASELLETPTLGWRQGHAFRVGDAGTRYVQSGASV